MTQAPAIVRASNPLTRGLLRLGVPMGPNVLLTVRGRTSGLPRSAPVAIAGLDGRRWIIAAYGDVQWVRNLRAAGEGDLRRGGHVEPSARPSSRRSCRSRSTATRCPRSCAVALVWAAVRARALQRGRSRAPR